MFAASWGGRFPTECDGPTKCFSGFERHKSACKLAEHRHGGVN